MVAIRSAQPEQSQALSSLDDPMSGIGQSLPKLPVLAESAFTPARDATQLPDRKRM
jgi:hypothetical protein